MPEPQVEHSKTSKIKRLSLQLEDGEVIHIESNQLEKPPWYKRSWNSQGKSSQDFSRWLEHEIHWTSDRTSGKPGAEA